MSKKTQTSKDKSLENKTVSVTEPVEVDWAAIAALEKQALEKAKQSEPVSSAPELISFEDWWLLREAAINKPQYYKEILRADSAARGLGKRETVDRWDWAGRQFGLKW